MRANECVTVRVYATIGAYKLLVFILLFVCGASTTSTDIHSVLSEHKRTFGVKGGLLYQQPRRLIECAKLRDYCLGLLVRVCSCA